MNQVIHILLISPGKCAEVRMQNLQQLRYLQELYNDNILTEAEYQASIIHYKQILQLASSLI